MIAFLSLPAVAQERGSDEARVSPNATVSQTIGTTDVMVTYGRPGIKGRDVKNLIHDDANGDIWRTGANESTVIVLSDDVMIESEEVPAGTYSIYTLPGDDEWEIIINKKLSWGTQYDEAEDVVRVPAESEDSFNA